MGAWGGHTCSRAFAPLGPDLALPTAAGLRPHARQSAPECACDCAHMVVSLTRRGPTGPGGRGPPGRQAQRGLSVGPSGWLCWHGAAPAPRPGWHPCVSICHGGCRGKQEPPDPGLVPPQPGIMGHGGTLAWAHLRLGCLCPTSCSLDLFAPSPSLSRGRGECLLGLSPRPTLPARIWELGPQLGFGAAGPPR